jgi:hypothetical protein
MDWGLAASAGSNKAASLTPESGLSGTPAYMAPEMAACAIERIGPASDIYLLGGILYEIVSGLRPHPGEDVYDCVAAAMENIIQPTDRKGELVDVALKAMAARPEDRHRSVKDFQRALRDYFSHAESAKLAGAAVARLAALSAAAEEDAYREATSRRCSSGRPTMSPRSGCATRGKPSSAWRWSAATCPSPRRRSRRWKPSAASGRSKRRD